MIGGREAGRAGADDEHTVPGLGGGRREAPAAFDRLVAEEALDRVDADRAVNGRAVARALAGVIADPPHHGRQRVVLNERAPGALVIAGFGVKKPALDVFARRAGVVAGRQAVDIDRALGAPGAGLVLEARADVERDGEGVVHQASPSATSRW